MSGEAGGGGGQAQQQKLAPAQREQLRANAALAHAAQANANGAAASSNNSGRLTPNTSLARQLQQMNISPEPTTAAATNNHNPRSKKQEKNAHGKASPINNRSACASTKLMSGSSTHQFFLTDLTLAPAKTWPARASP